MDYTSPAISEINEMTGALTDVLFGGITNVLMLFGVLIGLFFLVRLILRYIGRTK